MGKDLELDLDIKYIRTVLRKYSYIYKRTQSKLTGIDKKMSSRICFILFQFRNIFDNGLWL